MTIRFTFFIFVISSLLILGQNESSFFIKLTLSGKADLNKIEELKIPVYHRDGFDLYTILSQSTVSELKSLNQGIYLIDEISDGDQLYIVSGKKNSSEFPGQILYSGREYFFVKNPSSIENIISSGFSIVKLDEGIYFRNEKVILNNAESELIDSTVLQLTSTIDADSVEYFIQSLQDFQTRFLFADTRDAVADWIKNEFLRFGFTDVVIDSFQYQGTWQKNVIATITGLYQPEVVSIVGGHHDSYSSGDPLVFAPGADDNASGTAAVLEMARVIMQENYQPKTTLRFITFGAEEYGLWGSKDYAAKAFNSGMNIKFMINHDMISHTYYAANNSSVDLNYYSGFEYLRELAWDCTQNYSVLNPSIGSQNSSGSDSHSFWTKGFPSIYFEETNFSPFYHSPQDIISNYSMEYCAEVIKSSLATFLIHSQAPPSIENFTIEDPGNGTSLYLSWEPVSSPLFDYYKINVGTSSGVYTTTYNTSNSNYTITGLTEGTLYYIGVSVVESDGSEGPIVEKSKTPHSIPFAPQNLSAHPGIQIVNLNWLENEELDLAGYNIYRSTTAGNPGSKINQQVITDTVYTDNSGVNGVFYFYKIKAVDTDLNESEFSNEVKSRRVSLDQGILLVDETADGNGSILNPTDEEVDNFYHSLLSEFEYDDFDIISEGDVDLAVLGAYSTVIWHGNDYGDMIPPFTSRNSIKDYLDLGGNFFYTGFRPSKAFEQLGGLNGTFSAGDFIFDYLKIDETEFKVLSLFIGAKSNSAGYNDIYIDSSKTQPSTDYHIMYVESISANNMGSQIYLFDTNKDSTSNQGNMKWKPVGVEYIGNDFKTVTLSFPLYFMNQTEAKNLLDFILTEKFNEVTGVEEISELPKTFQLDQNYPNPFNPTTRIRYNVPSAAAGNGISKIVLKVYDVLGNEIATLVDEYKPAGIYEVNFSAAGLSSGIYFYRLQSNDFVMTRKMILIK